MEATCIKDLKVGARNLTLYFIVLEVSPRVITTKEGAEIRTCKVADRTACINLSIWGELGSYLQPGDICRMSKAYVASWKGSPTLYMGKGGELAKTSEFCLIFNETLNMSDLTVAPPQTAMPTTTNAAPPGGSAPTPSNNHASGPNNQTPQLLEIE